MIKGKALVLVALALAAACGFAPASGLAAGEATVGPLFTVTTAPASTFSPPSVARGASDTFVVGWQRNSGSEMLAFVRAFAGDGVPLSPEIQLGNNVFYNNVGVAMDPGGDFVASWIDSQGVFNQPGLNPGELKAQRYSAAGVAQGAALTVAAAPNSSYNIPICCWQSQGTTFNIMKDSAAHSPRVAMNTGGDFAVTWNNLTDLGWCTSILPVGQPVCWPSEIESTYAATYKANGVVRKWKTLVAKTAPLTLKHLVTTSLLDNGDVLMVFSEITSKGSVQPYAQLFNPNLWKLGAAIPLTGVTYPLAAATDAAGDVAVLWNTDTNPYTYSISRFRADGSSLGDPIAVGSDLPSCNTPALSMTPSGSFVAVWSVSVPHVFPGIDFLSSACEFDGQYFNADDSANGSTFVIDSGTDQENLAENDPIAIAEDSGGGLVVVWRGFTLWGDSPYSTVLIGRKVAPP